MKTIFEIRRSAARLAFAAGLWALTSFGQERVLTLENDALSVKWDAKAGRLSVAAKPSGQVVLKDGRLGEPDGMARSAAVQHKIFGAGQAITITQPGGTRQSLMVFPNVPFVLLGTVLRNDGAEPLLTNHVRVLSAALDLAKPLSELRAFGTGGLGAVESYPGSYAYLALVDPTTRAGVVGGWITQDRGSGVVLAPVAEGAARLEAQIDYGRLRVKPGAEAEAETFALGWFADARLGLEAYADAIAKVYAIKLPPQPSGYCTWYMEKHAGACDETHLAELAAFAARELKPFGFDFVQIDDQWQAGLSSNGPKRNFTIAAPKGPYPGGMKAAADNIKQLGLTPGIWFMPFAGTWYDPLFQEHQDWFAQTAEGKPFETRWGGTCLDMTQPGARDHLRNVVHRIAHDWGYTLFKMDGLWTGSATRLMYVNDGYKDDRIGEALLHDPDKTQIEAFRDGLKLVRETAGPKVFLLGCCVSQNMRSFGGSFGLLDAMRVGPDTGAGHIGAPHASRNYFLHGRVWQNDPDCVSVRTSTPLAQARVNASFTAIAGHLFYNSDWMPDLPAERLDILKRTLPAHGLRPRPVDLFENEPARIWLLTDTRQALRRDVVALFNWNQTKAARITCALDRLGLPAQPEFVAFDFWANKFIPPFRGQLSAELPAASCRVLAVRPVSDHPQLLSTSRHVTQGMVDVLQETWNASVQTLDGVSRLVAHDPYELRIIVPVAQNSWRTRGIGLSAEDEQAGVKSTFKQDGPKLRVTLTSAASRQVRWSVQFEPVRIESPPAPARDRSPGGVRLWQRHPQLARGRRGRLSGDAQRWRQVRVRRRQPDRPHRGARADLPLHRPVARLGGRPVRARLGRGRHAGGIESAGAPAPARDLPLGPQADLLQERLGPDTPEPIRGRQTLDPRRQDLPARPRHPRQRSDRLRRPGRRAALRGGGGPRRRKTGRPALERDLRGLWRREGDGRAARAALQVAGALLEDGPVLGV